MSTKGPQFPIKAETIHANLLDFFRHKELRTVILVLENANPRVVYESTNSGWNGGTNYYRLQLLIPMELFVRLEDEREKLEQEIASKTSDVLPDTGSDVLSGVLIKPRLKESAVPVVDADANGLWEPGFVRAFLSHLTVNKVEVAKLKRSLAWYGISGFVAHEDVEPTTEWRIEIENALWSMDVMVALITPEFYASKWTDQEVGMAMGRGTPIIPVKWGADPHGFIGKYQAVSQSPDRPDLLAAKIVDILIGKETTAQKVKEGLVSGLERASDADMTIAAASKLMQLEHYSQSQMERVWTITLKVGRYQHSLGVLKALENFLKKQGFEPSRATDDVPF